MGNLHVRRRRVATTLIPIGEGPSCCGCSPGPWRNQSNRGGPKKNKAKEKREKRKKKTKKEKKRKTKTKQNKKTNLGGVALPPSAGVDFCWGRVSALAIRKSWKLRRGRVAALANENVGLHWGRVAALANENVHRVRVVATATRTPLNHLRLVVHRWFHSTKKFYQPDATLCGVSLPG
jgi:hypothetical protein